MMKFISFKVSETEGINSFLKDNSNGIPAKGIYFHEGNLCFIYTDSTDAYQEKESLKASAKEFINKQLAEAAGCETDIRYWRWQATRGAQDAAKNVVDTEGRKEALLKQVQFARDMIVEIENGTWPSVNGAVDPIEPIPYPIMETPREAESDIEPIKSDSL